MREDTFLEVRTACEPIDCFPNEKFRHSEGFPGGTAATLIVGLGGLRQPPPI
jgi:hypothetical protein